MPSDPAPSTSQPPAAPTPLKGQRAAAVWIMALLLGLLAAAVALMVWRQQAQDRMQSEAALRSALLASELLRHDAIPLALADGTEVRALLGTGREQVPGALDARLERIAARSGTSVVYVINATGVAVASSNHRQPDSFIGEDLSFRRYFLDAMAQGEGRMFARGTTSGLPGYYMARRVTDRTGAPLGVVTVKVEFGRLEQTWARDRPLETIVLNEAGVIIITSVDAWRFHVLRALPQAVQEALRIPGRLGPGASLSVHPWFRPPGPPGLMLMARQEVPGHGWELAVLRDATDEAVFVAASALMLGGALGGLGGAAWQAGRLARRRRELLEQQMAEEARRLDREVRERTADLNRSNQQLRAEMAERQRAQEGLATVQTELEAAGRLATLGQISAGVAHEINQPLAALRAHLENSQAFLARGETGRVASNLVTMVELADRVGAITGELRGFARRSDGQMQPVRLAPVVRAALLLLEARRKAEGVVLELEGLDLQENGAASELAVWAERLRLEQVLVNLLANALDAVAGTAEPMIRMAVEAQGDVVRLLVSDSGPGIAPDHRASLFMPFGTTKPTGLGLGLVIARDIATKSGGSLICLTEPPPGALAGACFELVLRRAPDA
jgi:two-component system, NtrC family, C4-dicarboxylate transport sensor histidine kinase DctB